MSNELLAKAIFIPAEDNPPQPGPRDADRYAFLREMNPGDYFFIPFPEESNDDKDRKIRQGLAVACSYYKKWNHRTFTMSTTTKHNQKGVQIWLIKDESPKGLKRLQEEQLAAGVVHQSHQVNSFQRPSLKSQAEIDEDTKAAISWAKHLEEERLKALQPPPPKVELTDEQQANIKRALAEMREKANKTNPTKFSDPT